MQNKNAPLAQLDRALVYGTKGWGFELLRARHLQHKGASSALFAYLGLVAYVIVRARAYLYKGGSTCNPSVASGKPNIYR